MIYIQSYHFGVVGPVQVREKSKSLERPLVCMRRWLSASVVTTALSLTVLLICFSLDLDSDMTSVRVDQYVCMGCQSWQSWHGATDFPTYKAAACHYARSRACNQSNSCIRLVTIQSRPSDRDGLLRWCLRALATSQSQTAGLRYVIYTNQAIYLVCNIPPSFRNIPPFWAMEGGI